MQLFRQEAIDAQQAQWLGVVRLHRPWSFSVVTTIALGMGLALIAFAAWGQVNRKTTAAGLLMPSLGTVNLSAAQAGVVLERGVAEGQVVKAGELLFVIDTSQRSAAGETAALVARQIEARQLALDAEARWRELQASQRRQSLGDRLASLRSELQQQAEEIVLQERRVALAHKTLDRHQQLARESFVADAQVQIRQEEWMDSNARLQSLQRQRLTLQRDAQALQAELALIGAQLQTELAQLRRNRAAVAQEGAENAARQRLLVTAPQAGTVTALHLQAGQSVQTSQVLATIVPENATLEAQLWLPSQKAGFIAPGQRVYLRYAAYPYQKFGLHPGTVREVAATPASADELPRGLASQLLQQAQVNEALYRVRVELDSQSVVAYGATRALKPGMTLHADVLQERRAVWEWVLEPVLAAAAKVKILSDSPNKASPGG